MSGLEIFGWGFVAGWPFWMLLGYYLRYASCRAGRLCSDFPPLEEVTPDA